MNKKKRITLKRVFIFCIKFIKKLIDDDIFALASHLAYNLILAFIPFLMFLMTLIGFSNLNSNEILNMLAAVLPTSAFELIRNTVIEVVDTQQAGLLWISIVLAVWTASSGLGAVITGLNKAYGIKETRSYIKVKLRSIFFIILLAIIIISTLFLLVFGDIIGKQLIELLNHEDQIIFIWNITRYLILVAVMILVFASIYRFAPCKKLKWSQVSAGAAISTLGWIGISYVFSFYVNNFSNYSRLYGGLGAVFVLMTWIFLTSMILIVGGEVNAILLQEDALERI